MTQQKSIVKIEHSGSTAGTSFGRREWIFLAFFAPMCFVMGVCSSLQPPLYPAEATKKGVSASVYGAFLGFLYSVTFLATPILSICIMRGKIWKFNCGVRQCLLFFYFIHAVCIFLYGFLDFIDTTPMFILWSFVLRTFEGISNSGTLANLIAVCLIFPNHIARVTALTEALFYGSSAVGPLLGEMLYEIGGYTTAFIVFGTVWLCATFIGCIWLPEFPVVPETKISAFEGLKEVSKLLHSPRFVLYFCTCLVTSLGTGYVSTNLQQELTQFNLNPVGIGLMFSLLGLPLIACPLWGFTSDRTGMGEQISVFGSFSSAIGITFIGPAFFIPITPTVGITGIGLFLFGTGQGALLGSNFYNLVHGSRKSDRDGMIIIVGASVFYVIASTVGGSLGPTLAGVTFDYLGFRMSLFPLWILYAILFLVLVIVTLFFHKNQLSDLNSAEILPHSDGIEEAQPLLIKQDRI